MVQGPFFRLEIYNQIVDIYVEHTFITRKKKSAFLLQGHYVRNIKLFLDQGQLASQITVSGKGII